MSRGGSAGPLDARIRKRNRDFLTGLARAFGGAIFFALPLLMTMEMWWLGFYLDPARLALCGSTSADDVSRLGSDDSINRVGPSAKCLHRL